MSETDAAEAKRRAEWLHKHKAHKDWIILSVSEVTVIRDELLKLERERDEARKELEEYRSIAENIGAKKAISEKEQAIRERDELLNEIKRLRLDAQREAEHHDRMVKELEGLYDKLKS